MGWGMAPPQRARGRTNAHHWPHPYHKHHPGPRSCGLYPLESDSLPDRDGRESLFTAFVASRMRDLVLVLLARSHADI